MKKGGKLRNGILWVCVYSYVFVCVWDLGVCVPERRASNNNVDRRRVRCVREYLHVCVCVPRTRCNNLNAYIIYIYYCIHMARRRQSVYIINIYIYIMLYTPERVCDVGVYIWVCVVCVHAIACI